MDYAEMRSLTPDQKKWLRWLDERGGTGYVDRYGRIVASGEVSAQGASVAWLNLFCKGMISGSQDRLAITCDGKDELLL